MGISPGDFLQDGEEKFRVQYEVQIPAAMGGGRTMFSEGMMARGMKLGKSLVCV